MMCLYILVHYLLISGISSKQIEIKCPQLCICDYFENLRRATCTHHNVLKLESNFPQHTQILDLSYNQIGELDASVFKEENLLSLKLLNISYNKVSQIHMKAFEGMTQLKTLDLSHNSMQYILKNWFWSLESLEELYLKGNSFSKLHGGDFASKSLKVLDISNCHTSSIGPNTLSELPNLEHFDVSGNYIIKLTLNTFTPLSNLLILNANNMKLSCDEDFKKLLNYTTQRGIRFLHSCSPPKTANPEKFQRMINMAPPENVKNSWIYDDEEMKSDNGTKIIRECNNTRIEDKSLLQEIVDLSPVLAVLVPFIYGIAVGILIAYLVNVCMSKNQLEDHDGSTYLSFDDNYNSPKRRSRRTKGLSARFDRSYSAEERQQLPLREWNISESTPVLFRKNQVKI